MIIDPISFIMLNIKYNAIILKMRFEVNYYILESDIFIFSYAEDKDTMLNFISSLQMILFPCNNDLVLTEL
jgi:hypothetical protein